MTKWEFLGTVLVSVVSTLVVDRWFDGSMAVPAVAADSVSAARELVVDRLVVREELIVSDTGKPWDDGFEQQQIPRGMVVRSLAAGPDGRPGTAGAWVRGRLIKTEIDDPFDDRFHAMNRDGSLFRAPGHISWNVWLDGAWRQLAIIQGEGVENTEVPVAEWSGGNHPGRLRFQSFRPNHSEPLTDATLGQGRMSLGGGGYGGGGLPYPAEVLEIWGGNLRANPLPTPNPPRVVSTSGRGPHRYALIAIGADGRPSLPSAEVTAAGRAKLAWDSVPGADAYQLVRDGQVLPRLLRIEGSEKIWIDDQATPE